MGSGGSLRAYVEEACGWEPSKEAAAVAWERWRAAGGGGKAGGGRRRCHGMHVRTAALEMWRLSQAQVLPSTAGVSPPLAPPWKCIVLWLRCPPPLAPPMASFSGIGAPLPWHPHGSQATSAHSD